ncbi:PREDICTED: zinc fingers and homeoboxes protein 1 isoform X2 [Nanorana parkeri]|uniref:zinc fingers and homeoboxes protein 1 isoform X2 n=1 Tax=Nanorana parkeri TaxID=125878 RepID=UPI0008548A53|nr:PREDICTED: zinc fingers and homeoboxes protein 1 isoform X2 [Nanorana parkeri]
MASKRKSTTPCMVLASEHDPDVEMNSDGEESSPSVTSVENPAPESAVPEGVTKDGDALEPSDSDNQPSKIVEEHNTKHHPGEENFKLTMVKRNNQTIFEQTVNDLTFDGSFVQEENQEQSESNPSAISISKTPIMKIMKDKSEKKRITVSQNAGEDGVEEKENIQSEPKVQPTVEPKTAPVVTEPVKTNATIITSSQELPNPVVAPATVLQPGLAQVIATVQAQQNILSKVLIPVNSIPTYNTALDNNTLLLSNYKKFPYPTVSEISLLAAQTKCTEEQIKIWFSAQRLKHGVSWTPEEVEDARRKQFNGAVHTIPQTITVIPAQISSGANGLPSILQACQIVGQPGLVLTQVTGTNAIPVTTPITFTVAGLPSNAQLHASQIPHAHPVTETKRIAAIPSTQLPKQEPILIADVFGLRTKKTKEQLMALKLSYLRNQYPHNSEIERLIRLTGLTKGEIKKWFSDTRYNQRNAKGSHGMHLTSDPSGTIIIDSSDETNESPTSVVLTSPRKQSWNPFPDFTPQKFKEKTPEQLQTLEESFLSSTVPTDDELSKLRVVTKLTKREIDAWFAEKRRSMGVKEEPGALSESLDFEIKDEMDDERSAAFVAAKMAKKSPEQLTVLKNMFIRTQWPNPAEYDQLVQETGLARSDIVGWFGDTRYAAKNNHLKWFMEYQISKTSSPTVMNGQSNTRRRGRGRPRGRGRGRPRGRPKGRRTNSWERPPPPVKQKTGRALLKDYYLMHKFLNEEDLDELVSKSRMGYEQVRDWFAERMQREDAGLDPFEDEDEDDENLLDDLDDEEEIESDDSDTWEPPKHVKRRLSKMED